MLSQAYMPPLSFPCRPCVHSTLCSNFLFSFLQVSSLPVLFGRGSSVMIRREPHQKGLFLLFCRIFKHSVFLLSSSRLFYFGFREQTFGLVREFKSMMSRRVLRSTGNSRQLSSVSSFLRIVNHFRFLGPAIHSAFGRRYSFFEFEIGEYGTSDCFAETSIYLALLN